MLATKLNSAVQPLQWPCRPRAAMCVMAADCEQDKPRTARNTCTAAWRDVAICRHEHHGCRTLHPKCSLLFFLTRPRRYIASVSFSSCGILLGAFYMRVGEGMDGPGEHEMQCNTCAETAQGAQPQRYWAAGRRRSTITERNASS